MEERVRAELLSLVTASRAERGCINYDLHQSAGDKTLFMFYENWISKEALDEHFTMPQFNGFDERIESMLVEPVEITLWEMLSEQQ
ncbi:MAG: antibiotic biosynthesis monooxygenase [Acidobacteriota bacterium]|nr:antibiotic biosynthesis monooxygenase [Acidobacteriota bacterium]